MVDIILSLSCKIFIIVMSGVFGAKRGWLTEEMKKNLTALLMNLILPVSIIASSQQEFRMENLEGLAQSFLISLVYYVLVLIILIRLVRFRGMDEDKKRIFVCLIAFANVGFIGFSVMGQLLGDTGTLYTIAHNSVYQLFFFSFGLYYLKENGSLSMRGLFGNRIIRISLFSIFLYLLPFRFPQMIADSLSTLGSMMMPLSMIIIGAEIGTMNIKQVLLDKEAYLGSVIRMVICPLVMFGCMKILPVSREVGMTAVLLTALPSGSLNVIMAKEYQRKPEFATVVVAQNMILMVVLLPLFIVLSGQFL